MSSLRHAATPLLSCLLVLGAACSGDDAEERGGDEAVEAEPSTADDAKAGPGTPRVDGGATAVGKSDGGSGGRADSAVEGARDGGAKPSAGGASCLDGITSYDQDGPFEFTAETAGKVKLWVPKVPAGCKVPVVHLANGTGATCGVYKGVLDRLASHGFLACCYEDTNTGAGSQGLMALETAIEMYPELADTRIGSTGHSQGGQGAFTVLQLAEDKWGDAYTFAGLAIQPASGFGTQPTGGSWQSVYAKIKAPMFMFSGTADTLVSEAWVSRAFAAMPRGNEVYNWSAIGATHVPVPTAATQQVSIPWFRWKLLGDARACAALKALPDGKTWREVESQNAADCE